MPLAAVVVCAVFWLLSLAVMAGVFLVARRATEDMEHDDERCQEPPVSGR